jgi:hypothetical protein
MLKARWFIIGVFLACILVGAHVIRADDHRATGTDPYC